MSLPRTSVHHIELATVLPGNVRIESGTFADYRTLERFHYVPRRPATLAGICRATYRDRAGIRVIGVAVLSYPVPTCRPRERRLGLSHLSYGERLRFANTNLRTISRVIVHPQFRSMGVARGLIEAICTQATTRYVEAMAVMAQVHPMFAHAGMEPVPIEAGENYAYYLWENPNTEIFAPNST